MMFSSNQKLEVSGNLSHEKELETALEFALKLSGEDKNMSQKEIDRGCKLVYQITPSGKYCIGWSFKTIPEGWNEYPFKFDIDIVGKIIRQHLETFECPEESWEEGILDGAYTKGFVMKCIGGIDFLNGDIKNPFYGIVSFEPFTCFYSK